MNRRGVSPVIAVVLLIALTAAGAGVVWVFVTQLSGGANQYSVSNAVSVTDHNGDDLVDAMSLEITNNGDPGTIKYVVFSNDTGFFRWHVSPTDNGSFAAGEKRTMRVFANYTTDQLALGTYTVGLGSSVDDVSASKVAIIESPSLGQDFVLTLTSGTAPIEGQTVTFLREDGLPTGLSSFTTDENGQVAVKLLPFYYTVRYGSDVSDVFHAGVNRTLTLTQASNSVTVKVEDGAGGISGATVYATDTGKLETGISATTNSSGYATFSLSDGSYLFKVTYLSVDYFSSQVNLPGDSGVLKTISIGNTDLSGKIVFGTQDAGQNWLLRLYTDRNASLNRWVRSDANSEFSFTGIPSGTYRLRLDAYGRVFWSTVISTSDSYNVVNFGGGNLVVNLTAGNDPLPYRVYTYLFYENGRYAGRWARTNTLGQLNFGMVIGGDYKIRVHYSGQVVFTDIFTHSDNTTKVLDLGGGDLTIQIKVGTETLPNRVYTYLFTESGRYAGRYSRSNSTGHLNFGAVIAGTYKIRIDWMGRRTFTEVFNHTDSTNKTLQLEGSSLIINLTNLEGVKIPQNYYTFLFTDTGRYTGKYSRVDANGQVNYGVVLNGTYKIRVDFSGQRTYSDVFTHDNTSVKVIRFFAPILVVNFTNLQGEKIPTYYTYVFNEQGRYSGRYARIDSNGQANYGIIMNGTYKIRVDWYGKRIFTDLFYHDNSSVKIFKLNAPSLIVNLTNQDGIKLAEGAYTYLFYNDTNRYAGRYSRVVNGQVNYGIVINGTYKIRVNWLGKQTFTSAFTHNDGNNKTIQMLAYYLKIQINVDGNTIPANINTYLFNPNNRYAGKWDRTDASGYAEHGYILNGTYKLRVDYYGWYSYTAEFDVTDNNTIVYNFSGTAKMAIKVVKADGSSLYPTNTLVRLYTSTGRYTGGYAYTNSTGHVEFNTVMNGTYYIRVGSDNSATFQDGASLTIQVPPPSGLSSFEGVMVIRREL